MAANNNNWACRWTHGATWVWLVVAAGCAAGPSDLHEERPRAYTRVQGRAPLNLEGQVRVCAAATGELLATGAADSSGAFDLDLGEFSGNLLVQAQGGHYVELATGTAVHLGQETLQALVDDVAIFSTASVVLTPFAHLEATAHRRGLLPRHSFSTALRAALTCHTQELQSVLSEDPLLGWAARDRALDSAILAHLSLGGWSRLAADLGESESLSAGQRVTSMHLTLALAQDFSDGHLDGLQRGTKVLLHERLALPADVLRQPLAQAMRRFAASTHNQASVHQEALVDLLQCLAGDTAEALGPPGLGLDLQPPVLQMVHAEMPWEGGAELPYACHAQDSSGLTKVWAQLIPLVPALPGHAAPAANFAAIRPGCSNAGQPDIRCAAPGWVAPLQLAVEHPALETQASVQGGLSASTVQALLATAPAAGAVRLGCCATDAWANTACTYADLPVPPTELAAQAAVEPSARPPAAPSQDEVDAAPAFAWRPSPFVQERDQRQVMLDQLIAPVLQKDYTQLDNDAPLGNVPTLRFAVQPAAEPHPAASSITVCYRVSSARLPAAVQAPWQPLTADAAGEYALPLSYQTLIPKQLSGDTAETAKIFNYLARSDRHDRHTVHLRLQQAGAPSTDVDYPFYLDLFAPAVQIRCAPAAPLLDSRLLPSTLQQLHTPGFWHTSVTFDWPVLRPLNSKAPPPAVALNFWQPLQSRTHVSKVSVVRPNNSAASRTLGGTAVTLTEQQSALTFVQELTFLTAAGPSKSIVLTDLGQTDIPLVPAQPLQNALQTGPATTQDVACGGTTRWQLDTEHSPCTVSSSQGACCPQQFAQALSFYRGPLQAPSVAAVDGLPLPLQVGLHASCREPQGVFFYQGEPPVRLDKNGVVQDGL